MAARRPGPPGEIMASFAALDRRMGKDVDQLHNFLWHPEWKGDGEKLMAKLVKDGRELDAFLRVGGKLRRHVDALLRAAREDKERRGPALFELLNNTYHLTAATERGRRKDYKRAGEHALSVVESDSIGTCSILDSFILVEEWEAGKIDFRAYSKRLADVLQTKGSGTAGQFRRIMLAAWAFGKEWDAAAPKAQQAIAARAAVANAAWYTLATRTIRQDATGWPPAVPFKDYAAIVQAIVDRL